MIELMFLCFQIMLQKRYKVNVNLHQNLTDTDSTSVFFLFICELGCAVNKRKSRQIIFEVMIKSKIFSRLDLSDDFWG